jgi:hypothetical protein
MVYISGKSRKDCREIIAHLTNNEDCQGEKTVLAEQEGGEKARSRRKGIKEE